MAKKVQENPRAGVERATWPGDPEGEIEKRQAKERKENEAALKRKAELEKTTDTAPNVAPDKE